MIEDRIAEIGVDEKGRLYVRPELQDFPHIYRTALGILWEASDRRLVAASAQGQAYLDGFHRIVAAVADEYDVRLRLGSMTTWVAIGDDLRGEMEAATL